jgi:hypothetical protein
MGMSKRHDPTPWCFGGFASNSVISIARWTVIGLVDVLLNEHCNLAAAKRFFRLARAVTGVIADRVTTDSHKRSSSGNPDGARQPRVAQDNLPSQQSPGAWIIVSSGANSTDARLQERPTR